MKGTVEYINPKRGMVAVLTDEDYTIIELLGDEVEIGDVLQWSSIHPLGEDKVFNVTQKQGMDVFFQNHGVSKGQLAQHLLLET